jgi:hypothetical protein
MHPLRKAYNTRLLDHLDVTLLLGAGLLLGASTLSL